MSGESGLRVRLGAALLGCLCVAGVPFTPASAQTYVGRSAESPADAMARHLKVLASRPRDFNALVGAGKAALALGDTQAAAGFYGRAEEAWPQSPLPQIGKGAALAHEGDAAAALQYFARAVQLGAAPSLVGVERGLAHDLLGNHGQAQADYRASLAGPEADEARRRLALSLAINGDKDEALKLLAPLMAKGDAAGARCRAFVLALTGDSAGARAAIEAAMPGSSYRMAYFFQKLPALRSDQKAAAVHLGMFPDAAAMASAAPPPRLPSASPPASGDRLSSIDELLARGAPKASQPALTTTRVASISPTVQRRAGPSPSAGTWTPNSRYWVQLASGSNANALPEQFRRIVTRNRDSFDFSGLDGYVAEESGKARLLLGPFKDADDADTFARNLESVEIDAFSWTSQPGQAVRKLPSE